MAWFAPPQNAEPFTRSVPMPDDYVAADPWVCIDVRILHHDGREEHKGALAAGWTRSRKVLVMIPANKGWWWFDASDVTRDRFD